MALTDTFIKTVKPSGKPNGEKHSDGGGMYLHVMPRGKYWRMAYRFMGKQKLLSFGTYPAVTLLKARQEREKARALLHDGTDPGVARKVDKVMVVAAHGNSFKALAMEWHLMKSKSTSASTTFKRLSHMETHIFPKIGHLPIALIKPAEILWTLNCVVAGGAVYTAGRIREICGQVFRYAIQTSRAAYDPTVSMRGAIEKPVPQHRAALTTPIEFGKFLRDLKNTDQARSLTKLCARFGLLTWTRPKELRQAKWGQISADRKEWRIPAIEMKTGKQLQAHIVPLSPAAQDLIPLIWELSGHTNRLFPSSGNASGIISENTINNLFRRIGYKDKQSHHGLRASARSLLSERGWSAAALERQLDHKEANKAVAAYARSQYLEERRKFMDDWAALVVELEVRNDEIDFSGK